MIQLDANEGGILDRHTQTHIGDTHGNYRTCIKISLHHLSPAGVLDNYLDYNFFPQE